MSLLRSVYNHDIDEVKRYLEGGADANYHTKSGLTSLMLASSDGYLDMVELLLKHGANPNKRNIQGRTALMNAARCGYLDVVRTLVNSGADVNNKTGWELIITFRMDSIYKFKEIEDERMERMLNYSYPWTRNNGRGWWDLKQDYPHGWTTLMDAIVGQHEIVVKELIKYGANVNEKTNNRWKPLEIAVEMNNIDIVKELIKSNATIDNDHPASNDCTQYLITNLEARQQEWYPELTEHYPDVFVDTVETLVVWNNRTDALPLELIFVLCSWIATEYHPTIDIDEYKRVCEQYDKLKFWFGPDVGLAA